MSSEIEKQKRKRTTLKGMCTKIMNQINQILIEPEQALNISDLQSFLQKLKIKETEIIEVEDKIESSLENLDDLETELESRQEYRDLIIDVKIKLSGKIDKMSSTNLVRNAPDQANNQSTSIRIHNSNSVKLPKISMPYYDGSPENWLEFWNQYAVTVHDNNVLSKVEKFVYLRSYLKPPALTAIQGFELSENNYDAAIDILKGRFGKKDIVIRYKIDALLNLSPVRSANQIKELRSLLDALDVNIKSLENLGVDLKSYGNLLFPIVTKLLPTSIMIEYNKVKVESEEWDVQDLLKYLKLEVETREKTFLLLNRGSENFGSTYKNLFSNSNSKSEVRSSRNNDAYHKKSNSVQRASAFELTVSKCIFCLDATNEHDSKTCKLSLENKKSSLRKQGLCFLCLKKGRHIAKFCLSGLKCEKCSGRHSELICFKQSFDSLKREGNSNKRQFERSSKSSNEHNSGENENSVLSYKCSVSNTLNNNEILLESCLARITNNSNFKSQECVILYDSASQRNFINLSTAQKLNLPVIRKETLIIYPFSCDQPKKEEYSVVLFELSNLAKPQNKIKVEALIVNQISYTKLKVADDAIVRNALSGNAKQKICLTSMRKKVPDVLIGAKIYWKLHKYKKKISQSLYAISTVLGFCISGSYIMSDARQNDATVLKVECNDSVYLDKINECLESNDDSMSKICSSNDLQKIWSLDSLGITDNNLISDRDQQIINKFEAQLKYNQGYYVTSLLWNDEDSHKLENNFENAKRQLNNLRKRLNKDKWVFEEYMKIIEEQKGLGIVEECERSDNEYFSPHREVIRKDKQTSKVRIVFNCSSRVSGCKSLNDCLIKGPCLTPPILDIINKFRMFKIAFCADIEKAFLMIRIAESDRNFLKFLWFDESTQNYKVMRMTRVTFGCTTSPFFLTATIKKHIKDYKEKYPESYEMLNSSLFVDDLLYGSDTIEGAYDLTSSAVKILADAGMKLRKFSTNSEGLKSLWSKNDGFSEVDNNSVINVLGLVWYKDSDKLGLALNSIVENLDTSLCSKRYVLHTAAKFFDPIGIISPFLIRVKCFLQRMWERGLDWDQELPDDLKRDWVKWCNEIKDLLELRIDRCHFSHVDLKNSRIELHVFSDASPLAYGCVAYFRVISYNKECYVNMIMSKARVAPLKKLTLPRLELMGAVIAARVANYICDVFKIINIEKFYWTDSTIVLHWVKGSAKDWKPFVKNRVIEIHTLSEPEKWSYCNTKENPADLVTRGTSAQALINNKFWFSGPNWLFEVNGKSNDVCKEIDTSQVNEEKRKTPDEVILLINLAETVEPILNLENYSNLERVLRITAWIKRFLNNTSLKNEKILGPLTAQEIENAQKVWTKLTQNLSFPNELNCLLGGKPISKNSSLIEFSPFLDSEGIMRIGGRLQKSKFSFNEKHPVLLPSKGKLIELLIRNAHEKVYHFGISDTLVQLREQFWIIKGRQAVKGVLRKCTICKKMNVRSGDQVVAPLPLDRIEESRPFLVIGIDFAGPIYVRNSEQKYYILLCTCATTRALHLEIVENLTTEHFLLAFRRVVARRGLCHTIYSDNAKTFHRADVELRKIWKIITHPDVKNYFCRNRITWKFIMALSPWWGGFYERMVRSVKTALRKVVGKTTLSHTQLCTVLIEIEAAINSRPITYVHSTAGEPSPITPAHFLVGERLTSLPVVHLKSSNIPATSDAYIKRFNLRERLLQQFWNRWRNEYVLLLRSAMTSRPSQVRELSENDVVLINDANLPRHLWKLGLVTQVFVGRDGKIRSCQLKTANGTIKRPIQLLYNLELSKTE